MNAENFPILKDFIDFENNVDNKNYILASKLNDYFLQPIVAIYNNTICSIYLEDNIKTKDLSEGQKSSIYKVSRLKENMNPSSKSPFAYSSDLELARENDYIEIFEADIDEDTQTINMKDDYLRRYLCDLYDAKINLPFMVYNNGYIYGPFSMTNNINENKKIRVEKYNNHELIFGKYEVEDSDIVEFKQSQKTDRKIIHYSKFEKLLNTFIKKDFVSLDELKERVINDVARHNNRYKPEILMEFKSLMTDFINSSNKILLPDDIKRLEKINFTSNDFIVQLSTFLEPRYKEVNSKIVEKENELESLISEIEKKRSDNDVLNQQYFKSKEDIEKQLKIEQEKINVLKDEINELNNQKDNIRTEELERLEAEFSNTKEKLINIHKDIRNDEIYQDRLKSSIATLKKQFREEQEYANEVLNGLVVDKSYFDFLNGREFSKESNEEKIFLSFKSNNIADYLELRENIRERLIKKGRNLENSFIDNLLISIHQNTLTLFAGLPGTGKTSLARLLCKSLVDSERIREVSVSRGWTSQKDLIGFQNPLNDTFCSAPTNIYSLLSQLNFEYENKLSDDYPISYIILDEANLSPMEHYWSSFYALTDSYATQKEPLKINLGQGKVTKYNNTIRFIGTINFDQTTEELSHRVIDRANIIRLKPTKVDIGPLSIEEFDAINISFKQLRKLMKLFDFDQQEVVIPTKFKLPYYELKEIFYNDLNIYISPRIDIAITRYCAVAKDLMDDMRPLDFCVAQRLLPLINIPYSENKLSNLLNKMKEIFVGMENCISTEILTEIIEKGNEYQAGYNYFMTLSNV